MSDDLGMWGGKVTYDLYCCMSIAGECGNRKLNCNAE